MRSLSSDMFGHFGRRSANIGSHHMTRNSVEVQQLSAQWTNPSDVLSVLLLIGGDLVQKALAQTSGGPLTPVCFSFGWVAYTLIALVGLIGDGRLLPTPDYPAKVINLKSGYTRENRNWVVGRILRDNEIELSKKHPLEDKAIRIAVYVARPGRKHPSRAATGVVGVIGILVIIGQFILAAGPVWADHEYQVLIITAVGTVLAQSAAALPQWRAEKLPQRRNSDKNIAITSGNGSRHVMVIYGGGNAIDLEELAASETPRSNRVWQNIGWLSWPIAVDGQQKFHSNKLPMRRAYTLWGIPIGFWITLSTVSVQSIFWLALLISVAGIKSHTWYLLGVGLLGMFQNAIVAGISRGPEKRCLPLKLADVIITARVMDGLMDLETTHPGFGRPLLAEFFPGAIRPDEDDWWKNRKDIQQHTHEQGNEKLTDYDSKRMDDGTRGAPRSSMPGYTISRLSLLSTSPPEQSRKSNTFESESTATAVSHHHSQSPFVRSQSSISQASYVTDHFRGSPQGNRSRSTSAKRTSRTMSPSRLTPPIEEIMVSMGRATEPTGILPSDSISKHDFESSMREESSKTPMSERSPTDPTVMTRGRPLSIEDVYSISRSPPWA